MLHTLFLAAAFVAAGVSGYRTHDGEPFIHSGIHDPTNDAFPVPPKSTGSFATWEWISVQGATCMQQEQSGFWIREGNPEKLVVWLQGGGACFNSLCAQLAASQPKGYDEGESPPYTGVFRPNDANSTAPHNPLGDHTVVFVPYCTGDVFMGNQDEPTSFGFLAPAKRTFKGRNLIDRVMKALQGAPYINSKLSSFVLTGESAGGFGTLASWDLVRQNYFGDKGTHYTVEAGKSLLIDDSGIVMNQIHLTQCFSNYWNRLFNLNSTLPEGCPDCRNSLYAIYPFLQKKYPDDTFAFISSDSDETIDQFYGFGQYPPHENGECGDGKDAIIPLPNLNSGVQFRDGIKSFFLDFVIGDGINTNRFASYFFPGTDHTHCSEDTFFFTTSVFNDLDGKSIALVDWYQDILDGKVKEVESNLFDLEELAAIRKMKRRRDTKGRV